MTGRSVFDPSDSHLIMCRCENVTLGQVKASIHDGGARRVNEVKKLTRAGMGQCQGRTCAGLIEIILSTETQTPVGKEPFKSQAPVRVLPIDHLAALADRLDEPAGPVSVTMTRRPLKMDATESTTSSDK